MDRGDAALGEGAEEFNAAGVAYGVYGVADQKRVGVAEFGSLEARDLYPEHADIRPLVEADDIRVVGLAVMGLHLDFNA